MQTNVERVNSLLLRGAEELKSLVPVDWHLHTPSSHLLSETVTSVSLYGYLSKFERPNPLTAENRRKEAEESYVREDTEMWVDPAITLQDRGRFLRASLWISSALRGERFRYEDCWFGPGECFDSHRGRTTPLSKLNQLPWTVTAAAYKTAVMMIWSNRQLRRFVCTSAGTTGDRTESLRILNQWFTTNLRLVPGNRFATVPKNNEKDRDIGIEPKLNLMLQKGVGALIRRGLNRNIGWDLNNGQEYHRELIADPSYATIDLSSASNRLSLELVKRLVPRWLYKHIAMFRSPCSVFVEQGRSSEVLELSKVSSMGNGFTFELLTLILMGLARTFDSNATVYGDDIVIRREFAKPFMDFLTSATHFKVNTKKSFIDGYIRESCGAFYVSNVRVTRYDLRWGESVQDCIISRNKISKISEFLRQNTGETEVVKLLDHLVSQVDLQLKGEPIGPISSGLQGYWLEKPVLPCNPNNKKYTRFCADLQYETKDLYLLRVLFFDPSRGKRRNIRVEACRSNDPRAYTVLLKTMSLPQLFVRGDGGYIRRWCVVAPDGELMCFL